MNAQEFFMAIVNILFRNVTLWCSLKESIVGKESDILRQYAAPVIVLVQLIKFVIIGQPRAAMLSGITSFLVDSAGLYLISGAVIALLGKDRSESFKGVVLTVICYAMTPIWLSELFSMTGVWSVLFFLVALSHTVVVSRNGLITMLDLDALQYRSILRNITLLLVVVNSVAFSLLSASIRLFNI